MSEQMATTNIGMTKQNSTPTTSENQAELEAGCRKTQIWCIVGTRGTEAVTECGRVKHTKSVRDNPHEQHHVIIRTMNWTSHTIGATLGIIKLS